MNALWILAFIVVPAVALATAWAAALFLGRRETPHPAE